MAPVAEAEKNQAQQVDANESGSPSGEVFRQENLRNVGQSLEATAQPLRPKDLLGHLTQWIPSMRPLRTAPPTGPASLLRYYAARKYDDREALAAAECFIQDVQETGKLNALVQEHTWLKADMWRLLVRTTRRWLDTLEGREPLSRGSRDWEAGMPWMSNAPPSTPGFLMNYMSRVFGEGGSAKWAAFLWMLASSLLDMHAEGRASGTQSMLAGVSELMSLWNQFLRIGPRAMSNGKGDGAEGRIPDKNTVHDLLSQRSADWGFLQEYSALYDALLQQPRPFAQALELIAPVVPFVAENARGNQVSVRYDISSAVFVTLHLLRKVQDEKGQAMSQMNEFRPWVLFMESLMKASRRLELLAPLAKKVHTSTQADIKNAYVEIVASLELRPVGANGQKRRTDRGSAMPNRAAKSNAVDSAINGTTELRPTQRHAGDTRTKDFQAKMQLEERKLIDEGLRTISGAEQPEQIAKVPEARDKAAKEAVDELEPAAISVATPAVLSTPFAQANKYTADSRLDKLVRDMSKRLGRALETQDLTIAHRNYKEVGAFKKQYSSIQIPLELYEQLLLTFLMLREPRTALEIWQKLQQDGHSPTRKTYTVMMQGSQHVRDIEGMQHYWNEMRKVGIQPDAHAWSVLIVGFLRSGRTDAGLKCLQTMAQEWLTAAKAAFLHQLPTAARGRAALINTPRLILKFDGDVDGVARPGLVIMNSAVSALAAKDEVYIPRVLAWGRAFGIEPDITTYNVLLNLSMRHSLFEETKSILDRMKKRGIAFNSTTWTVLINIMFRRGKFDSLEPEDQEKAIIKMISEVESFAGDERSRGNSSGIDGKGYALIIDQLLKSYGNQSAVQAVLAHMQGKGVEPSSHVYTMLMTTYFQQSPPDFNAAEALWARLESANHGFGAVLDSIFYDRMVEGYGRHHHLLGSSTRMLRFLERMHREGKKPSWRALAVAAKCLTERGEREQLAKLVQRARIRLQEGMTPVGGLRTETLSTGMRDFVECVVQSGILEHEDVKTAEDYLRNVAE